MNPILNQIIIPQTISVNSITIANLVVVDNGSIILRNTDNCIFNINNFLLSVNIIHTESNQPDIKMNVENSSAVLQIINPNNPLGVCSSIPLSFAKDNTNKQIYIDFSIYQIMDKFVLHYTFLMDFYEKSMTVDR